MDIIKEIRELNSGIEIKEFDFLVMKKLISEQKLILPEGYTINKDGFLAPCSSEVPIKVEIIAKA